MRVLIVTSSYPRDARDWRGRFIADMVEHLGARPDLECGLWAPPGARPAGVAEATTADDARWLARLADEGGIAHVLRDRPVRGIAAAVGLLRRLRRAYRRAPTPDIAHVNWLQNALPLHGTRLPALITVLGSDFGMLRLPGMAAVLRRVFRQRRCILAPNAAWMAARLEHAFGDVAEVRPIPFGVADAWFDVRRTAGAPADGPWLVVTRLTAAKLGSLLAWGKAAVAHGRKLHLFGPMQERIALPEWMHYHGPVDPAVLREAWFPRAAGLVTLSVHDEGRPQVVLEAMASGLPIIASDIPAHRDLVEHGVSGWLVNGADDFEAALSALSAGDTNRRAGEAARGWVMEHVGSWRDCAACYVAAYQDLLQGEAR